MERAVSVSLIEIQSIVHATESREKVLKAIKNVLPDQCHGLIKLSEQRLKGHYNNPITLFKFKLDDQRAIKAFIESLAARLDPSDKEYLSENIGRHLSEDGRLYLRLNKQSAFLGQIKLGREDPIRIQMKLDRKLKRCELVNLRQDLNLLSRVTCAPRKGT